MPANGGWDADVCLSASGVGCLTVLIEPIETDKARVSLPRREETASGLFAWGLPRGGDHVVNRMRLEFAFIFIALPFAGVIVDARSFIPIAIALMMSSTVALLSMTRNFHWSDLLPADPLSEWRIIVGFGLFFAAGAAILATIFAPASLLSMDFGVAPMLIAFPLVTAAPVELVHRVLLLRRFGRLFPTEWTAIVVGAGCNGLLYLMLSGSMAGATFGAAIAVANGWVYLRTGQFLLTVLIHWIAAVSIFYIGPGLLLF